MGMCQSVMGEQSGRHPAQSLPSHSETNSNGERTARVTSSAGRKHDFPMSFQSSPSLPRRKYGSLEPDDSVTSRLIAASGANRSSSGEGEERSRGRRWFSTAVVGTLAVGVMMGLAQAGKRLPTGSSNSSSTFSGDSLLEVSEAGSSRSGSGSGSGSSGGGGGSGSGEVSSVTASSPRSPSRPAVTADSLEPLSFSALNFYHVRDGKPALDYPWLKEVKLIEPHRDTTLTVTSPRDGFKYTWAVHGGEPDKADLRAEASGAEAVVKLTVLDDNVITLEEVDEATGKVSRRLEEKVMVKYVRREIRTLTDDEREELFDAMYTLWSVKVDGGNGKELYGDDYADIYAINRLHYKAASPIDCDHFHDGLGFMTNHAMISNTFEYSLQKVNPKLTLPYWDFTIDGSSAGGATVGGAVSSAQVYSEIFSPTWFGTYDEEDYMVKDGRWGYTPIPMMRMNNPGEVTPDVYEKLRAPWNVNDRAYLTRGMGNMCGIDTSDTYPWPSCATHYELATEYDSFYSYVWESLYDPHGPVHIWIGGVLDCERSYAKIGELIGEYAAGQLAMFSFVHRKNMYRENVFSCEGVAGVNQKPDELLSSGQCGCLGYDLTQGDDYEEIYNRLDLIDDLIGDMPADIKRQVVAIICSTTINDGDHLQASSSLDPSFWATHPTMERLWMYAVLTGHVTDFSWPDENISYTDEDGSTVTETLSLYGEDCTGHRGSDVFPFGLLDSDDDGFTIKTGIRGNNELGNTLTNREALQAFDPRSNSLPYVYDTFRWTHCEDDGVDFSAAWKPPAETKPKAAGSTKRPSFKEGEFRSPRYSGMKDIKQTAKARREEANRKA